MQQADAMSDPHIQIWNNAVFDDGCSSGGSAATRATPHRYAFRPVSAIPPQEPLVCKAGKENRGPALPGTPSVGKSLSLAGKPSSIKPIAALDKKGLGPFGVGGDDALGADDGNIDAEIEQVEKEIRHLTSRLEDLRLRKAQRDSRAAARRGRIVPARFLDPKQNSSKNPEESLALRKTQESPASARFTRRRASLGPLDIVDGSRLLQPEAPNTTPLRSVQTRRKSCILKLQDIIEEDGEEDKKESGGASIVMVSSLKQGNPTMRVADSPAASTNVGSRRRGVSLGPSEIAAAATIRLRQPGKKTQEIEEDVEAKKERGRSLSLSPKSRQSAANMTKLRKGIATSESKKPVKMESTVASSLQPRTLFQEVKKPIKRGGAGPKSLQTKATSREVKKSLPAKRPCKNVKARTVSSRYSLITVRVGRVSPENKRRKWSLPGGDRDEPTGIKKSRVSLPVVGQSLAVGNQWQWERPSEVDEGTALIESPPPSIMRIAQLLPKIRTVRCSADSPRDSGRAKRVIELIGRESPFGAAMEEEEEEATPSASGESMDLGEDEQ